jgi:polyisoprenoid-binding protein YceI
MKSFKWLLAIVGAYALAFASLYAFAHRPANGSEAAIMFSPIEAKAAPLNAAASCYRLDAGASKFMAHASRSGLFWFKGHGHHIAIREFNGEAVLDPDSLGNSSLTIIAKSASMEETSDVLLRRKSKSSTKSCATSCCFPINIPRLPSKARKSPAHQTGRANTISRSTVI